MKKLINDPAAYVDEMLDGLTLAHPGLVRDGAGGRVIRLAKGVRKGKVGIASGGGSGHLPLFTGYVGRGLIDTCSVGNVIEGPNVDSCMDATRLADGGRGVLRLYGNYGGDRMNFDMAGEMLDGEIETATVLGADDVASAAPQAAAKRRGVAGLIFAYKAAGAMADSGTERAAAIYTLIVTAKLNGLDPRAWLADVLRRIADHPASRLGELLPWNWRTTAMTDAQAAYTKASGL